MPRLCWRGAVAAARLAACLDAAANMFASFPSLLVVVASLRLLLESRERPDSILACKFRALLRRRSRFSLDKQEDIDRTSVDSRGHFQTAVPMRPNGGGGASSSLSSPLSLRELVSSGLLEKIQFVLPDDGTGNITAAGELTAAAGSEADDRRLRLFQLNAVELFLLLIRTVSSLTGGPGSSSGTTELNANLDCRNIGIEFRAEFDHDDYQVGLSSFSPIRPRLLFGKRLT